MHEGIKETLTEDLALRAIEHRDRFYRLFINRYCEMLPSLIDYKNKPYTLSNLKLEWGLRNGYNMIVGQNTLGEICVMGYSVNINTTTNPLNFFQTTSLRKSDINFIIPKQLIPEHMFEITELNVNDINPHNNFVVVRNKPLMFTNDFKVIEHYANEICEIVLSRYSLIMQSKINTFLRGDLNDEGINKVANALYNGAPYIKTSKYFDPEEDILTFDNANITSSLAELKREYQNKINENNSFLGINSLGVDKESGVSDIEAKSGDSWSSSNANIFLEGRQPAFDLLNKKYGLDIKAQYNNIIASEMMNLTKELDEKGGKESENDNDSTGTDFGGSKS